MMYTTQDDIGGMNSVSINMDSHQMNTTNQNISLLDEKLLDAKPLLGQGTDALLQENFYGGGFENKINIQSPKSQYKTNSVFNSSNTSVAHS